MEVPGGHSNKLWVLIYEMLGTAILLLGINLSNMGDTPYAVGFSLFSIIMMIGPVSGGHVNPAVSMAVLVREGLSKLGGNILFFALIVVFQILGAGLGVLLTLGYGGKMYEDDPLGRSRIAKLCPANSDVMTCEADGNIQFPAFMAEFFGTFLFTSVILSVKYNNGASELAFNALVIAITLYNVVQQTKNISGAAINPAVGIVMTIYQQMQYGKFGYKLVLSNMWIYIAGPLLGGTVAGLFSHLNASICAKLADEEGRQNTMVADNEEPMMDDGGVN